MALKGDRVVLETDITLSCVSAATRGVIASYGTTSGSGIALGDSAGTCDIYAAASGHKVAGILMNDVVSIDETQYHRNFHKDQTMTNAPCVLLRKGKVTTDQVSGTPAVDDIAYLTSNGQVTPTKSTTGGTAATPIVGRFKSIKDANSFVTLEVNLPYPV